MRLPPVPPADLTSEQLPLYEDMKAGITAKYNEFETIRDDGAIMGPWNAWLHEPKVGEAIWGLVKAMTRFHHLPEDVRQIAILVVGARFQAAYEIYAHSVVAKKHGLSDAFLAALLAGARPEGMTEEQRVAYEVAHRLTEGGVLPEATFRHAVTLFGQKGANELIYLVGHYCLVSMTLNGFDVPVPA